MRKKENQYVKKWKPPIVLYILLFLIATFLSLLIGTVYENGDLIYDIIDKLSEVLNSRPLLAIRDGPALTDNLVITGKTYGSFLLILSVYILLACSKERNYMPGKEYGVARWATPQEVNKKFMNKKDPHVNRIYSENVRVSMKSGRINNNVLVIGGSGTGKSFRLLTPNLYMAKKDSKYPGSFVCTDPKGELLSKNGALLKERGYRVMVLNLVGEWMKYSDRFNPFVYIRTEEDIMRLITNLQDNTTVNAAPTDPFWPKAEAMFLKALFLLVWMEHERLGVDMNMNSVLYFLRMARVPDKGKNPLDTIFARLAATSELGESHPAYDAYNAVMTGAADTIRSVLITVNTRMDIFKSENVKRILSGDDMNLASIGSGKINGKKNVKTALFCIIPDSDTTYNCIAGMLYTCLFQELYYQSDFLFRKALPVPVTFWLDEFANIALPNDFLKELATMRSRNISSIIIIQSLPQLKERWEKTWESILDNCDTRIFLGGNGESTAKSMSESLGKMTMHKKTYGESKGPNNGSASTNDDVIGRELMLPEEVREMDNDYCIVLVRGQKPVIDFKVRTEELEDYKHSVSLGLYDYDSMKEDVKEMTISILEKPEESAVTIELIESESEAYSFYAALDKKAKENEKKRKLRKHKLKNYETKSIKEILMLETFTTKELIEITEGVKHGLTETEIKSYMFLGDPDLMQQKRIFYETFKE